jgi:[ribosomal protein S5]-alanine N-acetyltransferase
VPENTPSRDLLRKIGFKEEGYARKYLRINGSWRDHLLFAWISTDRRPDELRPSAR